MTDETVVRLNRPVLGGDASQSVGYGPGRPWEPVMQGLEAMIERARANGAVGAMVLLAYPGGNTQSLWSEVDRNAGNALLSGIAIEQVLCARRIVAESEFQETVYPPPDDAD